METITILVPLYNEEEMLPIFLETVDKLFIDSEKYQYEYLFVNDGSTDKTLELLKEAYKTKSNLSYISFSRNSSQESALQAGLKASKGDIVIPMDCDLQDPPEIVLDMLKKYEEGYEVVNAKRNDRSSDSALKRFTSQMFYKVQHAFSGKVKIPQDVSYYRLLSRKVVNYIVALPESMRLLKTEIPYIGFKTCEVFTPRRERAAGKTKYHFNQLFDLAENTMANSSLKLLRLPFQIGISLGAITFFPWLIILIVFICNSVTRVYNGTVSIWLILTSILLSVALISLIISIPCIYLKAIMQNTQKRPNYYIEEEAYSRNYKEL